MLLQALDKAGGQLFTPNKDGGTSELERLLSQWGLRNMQTRAYALHFQAGTTDGELFFEDVKHAYRTFVPFLRKWTRVPDDYEEIYQQATRDMQQKDFIAKWNLLTVWGNTPLNTSLKEG